MRRARTVFLSLACAAAVMFGASACGGDAASNTPAAPDVDLASYSDLASGRVMVIGSDGEETDWELDDVDDNEVAFSEAADGSTFVVSATVLSTKSDFQLRSGDTVDAAMQLAATLTVAGHPAATALTVEVDAADIADQGIEEGDQVLVASTNWDLKYDEMRAPVEVLKVS